MRKLNYSLFTNFSVDPRFFARAQICWMSGLWNAKIDDSFDNQTSSANQISGPVILFLPILLRNAMVTWWMRVPGPIHILTLHSTATWPIYVCLVSWAMTTSFDNKPKRRYSLQESRQIVSHNLRASFYEHFQLYVFSWISKHVQDIEMVYRSYCLIQSHTSLKPWRQSRDSLLRMTRTSQLPFIMHWPSWNRPRTKRSQTSSTASWLNSLTLYLLVLPCKYLPTLG